MIDVDLGQIFTKRTVADYMVSLFTLPSKSLVLDPCFGSGVFLESISANTDYLMCGYEIDSSLYNLYVEKYAVAQLHNADFLLSDITACFDGVIMNPPYIRHEKIDELQCYGITKANLAGNIIFSTLPKNANLYMYFILKALDTLRENGELIVIFPESWINAQNGKVFKKILLARCHIVEIVYVNGSAFEKNALVDVVILKLVKSVSNFAYNHKYISADGGYLYKRTVEQLEVGVGSHVSIKAYSSIRRGITTGFNRFFINPPLPLNTECLVDIISSPKSVNGFSTKTAKVDKLLVVNSEEGMNSQLVSYIKRWENQIVKANNPKTIANKITNGSVWYKLNPPKCSGILFGYMIREDMRFILNDSDLVVRDNFYIIEPNINVFIMLSLLSNYYVYVQLETNGRKYGGGMLKLQKYDLESLLITDISQVSAADKSMLEDLGRKLAVSGDKALIEDITRVLADYETVSADKIKSQYENMRLIRLENVK